MRKVNRPPEVIPWRPALYGCPRRLVDGGLEGFARFEFWLVRRGDLDGFAGARVTSGGGGATRHAEGTKAHETYFRAVF